MLIIKTTGLWRNYKGESPKARTDLSPKCETTNLKIWVLIVLSTERFMSLWSSLSGSCWTSQRDSLVWKVYDRCVLDR